jgi:hypothetical protein
MAKALFLSYAEEDSSHADQFKKWFRASLNIDCFMARADIKPGTSWKEQIREAIRTSRIGVVLVTSRSYRREWVNSEVGALLSHAIPVYAIQLRELDTEPFRMVALEEVQHYVWSLTAASIIASHMFVVLRQFDENAELVIQPVDFCIDQMQLGPRNEKEFIAELDKNRPLRDSPSLKKIFTTGDQMLAHILIDPFMKEYCDALDEAVRGKGTISLTTRDRMKVAERMVKQAADSILAISVLQNDPWLFDDGDQDSYILENNLAGERLKNYKKVCRLVILPDGVVPHEMDGTAKKVLNSMVKNHVSLQWLNRNFADSLMSQRDMGRVENLLIVDNKWMTESTGKGHDGRFSVSIGRIEDISQRFKILWSNSKKFEFDELLKNENK